MSCNQTLGCLRLYGDSRVSRAQPRINSYEILLQYDWLLIFSRQNRFAETHSHLQLSYNITDRLLAAGNSYVYLYLPRVHPGHQRWTRDYVCWFRLSDFVKTTFELLVFLVGSLKAVGSQVTSQRSRSTRGQDSELIVSRDSEKNYNNLRFIIVFVLQKIKC